MHIIYIYIYIHINTTSSPKLSYIYIYIHKHTIIANIICDAGRVVRRVLIELLAVAHADDLARQIRAYVRSLFMEILEKSRHAFKEHMKGYLM